MQTAKSHQALLLTTRPTTLFTNMTILHLLPKKSSRELKLKSACPHLHADRHTPSSRTHLICYSIFSFFVWCLGFCIWFDLLKPVVMGFQPVVNLFAFFFFFFFVWCLGFCIWFVPFWCSWWWVFNPWWWSLHLLHLGFQTHVNLQNQATNFSNRTIPTSNHISLVYLFLPMSIIVFFKTFVKLI